MAPSDGTGGPDSTHDSCQTPRALTGHRTGYADRPERPTASAAMRLALLLFSVALVLPASGLAQERIVLWQDTQAASTIWTLRPDGSDARTLVDLNTDPRRPVRSVFWTAAPNGRDYALTSLTAVRAQQQLIVRDHVVAGTLRTAPAPLAGFPVYSPSGRKVAFVVGTDLEVITPGAGAVKLGSAPGLTPTDFGGSLAGPAWSPDESALAFLTPAGLEVVPIDGGPHHKMAVGATVAGAGGIAWSPSGDAILVAGDDLLVEVSLASGDSSYLARGPTSIGTGAYAPDGAKIAFTNAAEQLVVISANDGRQLHIFRDGQQGAWSPDSRRIAYVSDHRGVRVANASGSRDHQIAPAAMHYTLVDQWLANAITPPPDRSRPAAARTIVVRRSSFGGGFRDEPRSSPIVAAKVSVVRRVDGVCHALTRDGFQQMSCVRAGRVYVAAKVVPGRNGSEWRVARPLPHGNYRIRVSVRDAAGNTTTRPVAMTLRV